MPPADSGSPEVLHGLTLEQVAGVNTALAEGFTLEAILASEQIPKDAWPEAELAWTSRVARDGAQGPIFGEYAARCAVAEDCLSRAVTPIDTELPAWIGFLQAYAAHAAPAQMMASLGLGPNDLSRLQRRWERRLEQDPALAKQAAELAKKGPCPLPKLVVGAAKLTLFPWSRRGPVATQAAPEADAPRAAVPADTSFAPGKIRLYSYVAVKARLAESPGREQEVLAELGLSDFAVTDAGWQVVLRDNPDLRRDYEQLLRAQRAKARVAAIGASGAERKAPLAREPVAPVLPAVHRAPAHLVGTALPSMGPAQPALPFMAPSVSAEAEPKPPTSDLPRPQPRSALAGTALAVDVPRGLALPFASKSAPELTLEQHASLSCELAEAPGEAAETLARYRITEADKLALDAHYAAERAREPAAQRAWDAAYQTYRAWWSKARGGP